MKTTSILAAIGVALQPPDPDPCEAKRQAAVALEAGDRDEYCEALKLGQSACNEAKRQAQRDGDETKEEAAGAALTSMKDRIDRSCANDVRWCLREAAKGLAEDASCETIEAARSDCEGARVQLRREPIVGDGEHPGVAEVDAQIPSLEGAFEQKGCNVPVDPPDLGAPLIDRCRKAKERVVGQCEGLGDALGVCRNSADQLLMLDDDRSVDVHIGDIESQSDSCKLDRRMRAGGWTSLALGVAFGGAAGATGWWYAASKNDFEEGPSDERYGDPVVAGIRTGGGLTWAFGTLGVLGLAAAIGLLATAKKKPSSVAVLPAVLRAGAGAGVAGRF